MTVKELKEQLVGIPDEALIVVSDELGDYWLAQIESRIVSPTKDIGAYSILAFEPCFDYCLSDSKSA